MPEEIVLPEGLDEALAGIQEAQAGEEPAEPKVEDVDWGTGSDSVVEGEETPEDTQEVENPTDEKPEDEGDPAEAKPFDENGNKDHKGFEKLRVKNKEFREEHKKLNATQDRMMKVLGVSTIDELNEILDKAEEGQAVQGGLTPEQHQRQKALEQREKELQEREDALALEKNNEIAGRTISLIESESKAYGVTQEEAVKAILEYTDMDFDTLMGLNETARNNLITGAFGSTLTKEEVEKPRPEVETKPLKGQKQSTKTGVPSVTELIKLSLNV